MPRLHYWWEKKTTDRKESLEFQSSRKCADCPRLFFQFYLKRFDEIVGSTTIFTKAHRFLPELMYL